MHDSGKRSGKETRMFTAFDLLQMLGALMGAAGGGWVGHGLLGWVGAALGTLVGWVAGFVVGGLPFFFAARSLVGHLSHEDLSSLVRRLVDEFYISHLILAELKRRGEDLARFEEPILGLMQSESNDRRRHGWASLQRFYPARAEALANYAPEASVEDCRQQIANVLARSDG